MRVVGVKDNNGYTSHSLLTPPHHLCFHFVSSRVAPTESIKRSTYVPSESGLSCVGLGLGGRGGDGGLGEVDQVAGGTQGAAVVGGGGDEGAEVEPAVAEPLLVQRRRQQRAVAVVRDDVGLVRRRRRRAQLGRRRGRGARAAQGLPGDQAGVGRRPRPDRLPRLPGNPTHK